MEKKTSAKTAKAEGNGSVKPIDISAIMQMVNETRSAIEQYKAENPGVDVDAILSTQNELLPTLRLLSSSEIGKFVAYAKGQGTKMPFGSMEAGILAAGRKDMQNGLAEIADALKFEKPICPESDEGMDNRGRSKKKS